MRAFIDPSVKQNLFMTPGSSNIQFPYKIIGLPGQGFVPEADFKTVVHELYNLKHELGLVKKVLIGYESGRVGTKELPEDSPPHLLWAEIFRLRHALKGPDGFETWQDAAVDERRRRVALDKELADIKKVKVRTPLDYEVERLAKEIYEGWKRQPGYTPWQDGGNSHMQERARDLARNQMWKERET